MTTQAAAEAGVPPYCAQPPQTKPALRPDLSPNEGGDVGGTEQLDEVRRAFQEWKDLGIGLEFEEVSDPADAEVRAAFQANEGSWSYVGRDVLLIGAQEPTMGFGWDLTSRYGRATARHEVGHTLGFAHEHQNPFAGIRTRLGGRPEGPILQPEACREGIESPLSLSAVDKERVLHRYPSLSVKLAKLQPFESAQLQLSSGQQADFQIVPPETRKYELRTFGDSDVLLVLFEDLDGELRYVTGEDDSGEDRNGHLEVKLVKGRRYVARARLHSTWGSGGTAFMYW